MGGGGKRERDLGGGGGLIYRRPKVHIIVERKWLFFTVVLTVKWSPVVRMVGCLLFR